SEEHTSELQSLTNLVCRLLLEKKENDHRAPQRCVSRAGGERRGQAAHRGRRRRSPGIDARRLRHGHRPRGDEVGDARAQAKSEGGVTAAAPTFVPAKAGTQISRFPLRGNEWLELLESRRIHGVMALTRRQDLSSSDYSITCNFPALFHFFSCRSRCNADSRVSCSSNQTSILIPYSLVKPGIVPVRCSHARRTRSSVMPM